MPLISEHQIFPYGPVAQLVRAVHFAQKPYQAPLPPSGARVLAVFLLVARGSREVFDHESDN